MSSYIHVSIPEKLQTFYMNAELIQYSEVSYNVFVEESINLKVFKKKKTEIKHYFFRHFLFISYWIYYYTFSRSFV